MLARVDFGKPDIPSLLANGMTAVDMHFHSLYSDTYTKIDNILRMADKMKIGVAITDHNEIKGALEAQKKKEDQLLIPGIEIACHERCHLLFYFMTMKDLKEFYYSNVEQFKSINPYTVTRISANEIMRKSEDFDCLACAAHPFGRGFMGIYKNIKRGYVSNKVMDNIQSVEVINGANRRTMNLRAVEWAEYLDKGFTGGSDGHALFQLGKVVTCSRAKTVKGFINSIKEQENYVVGKEIGLVKQVPSGSRMLRRHLRYFRPTMKLRYEVSLKPSIRYHVPRLKRSIGSAKENGIEKMREIAERSRKRIDYRFERL